MEEKEFMVDFEKYCKTCKHEKLKENCDPCNDCLDYAVNTNSEKPVHYEEKEDK